MLKNYLKIAFRNILKHKAYSFINILGLAGSIAITILILIYARTVLTYDQFHEDSDQIYFMYRDRPTETGRLEVFDTWFPVVEVAKEEFPQIVEGTRTANFGNSTMQFEDRLAERSIMLADSNFFNVFSFDLIKGDPSQALLDPNSIVISQTVANELFGNEEPIGKTVTINHNQEVTVTGILADIPVNSTLQFDCVAPLTTNEVRGWLGENLWGGSFCNSYMKLRADADVAALKPQLNVLMDKYVAETEKGNFLILPLKEYYDKMTGQVKYAHIMLLVALGILIIAIINFTNLSTAQSLLRTKEVGVRKVLGSSRNRLITQFLSESLFVCFMALILGGFLAELFLPTFNGLIGLELDIPYTLITFLVLIALGLLVGIISGSYPALFVSKLQPNQILKGQKTAKKFNLRNLLVGVQFVLAITLISSLGVILSQINYLKSHDLNFDQENVVVIPLSLRDFEDEQVALPRIISFRNELREVTGVESVSGSSSVPGNYRTSFTLFLPKGKEDMPPLDWQVAVIDHDFFKTYGVNMLEGREYIQGSRNDFERGVILNQAALDQIGWESIEGKKLLFPRSREELDIIGLVEDFNVQSLRNPVQPLVHYYGGDSARSYRYISVKLNSGDLSNTIGAIESVWKRMDFGNTFEYYFPSERFQTLYETEENIASVLKYAMAFAIIIACFGLYALASFSVMLKTKEIAVRKVMGASVNKIIQSFTGRYILLVMIAALPAIVLTWYGMSRWLQDFAYKVAISPWVFVVAICGAVIIAILTVSYHAVKAGFTNPVDSLKEE